MFVAAFLINLINVVLGIIEAFIGLRIVLKLAGANPLSPFVAWIYETSRALIWPFLNMFPSPTFEGGTVVEFNALIALLVYAFIGYLLMELVGYVDFHGGHYRTRVTTRKGKRVIEEEIDD